MTSAPQQPSAPPPAAPPPGAGPAKTDYTMAWLAHLLLLFTCFIGPLIIWLVKKDQDKYAAFHGKQAFFWWIAVAVVVFCLYILTFVVALVGGPLAFLPMCLMSVAGLGNLAYVIYAIVQTSQGKPFKYFFVADQFCKREFAEAYPGQ
jgi:uncharacterized Tic20 family protein